MRRRWDALRARGAGGSRAFVSSAGRVVASCAKAAWAVVLMMLVIGATILALSAL